MKYTLLKLWITWRSTGGPTCLIKLDKNSWCIQSLLRIHPKLQHVQQHLQYHRQGIGSRRYLFLTPKPTINLPPQLPGYVLVVAWRHPWLPVQQAALLAVDGLQSRWAVLVLWCDRVASLQQYSLDGSVVDWNWHHDSERIQVILINGCLFNWQPGNSLTNKKVHYSHFGGKKSQLYAVKLSCFLHDNFHGITRYWFMLFPSSR